MTALREQVCKLRDGLETSRENHEHGVAIQVYEAMLDRFKPLYEGLESGIAEKTAGQLVLGLDIAQTLKHQEGEKLGLAKVCLDDLKKGWIEEDHRVKQNPVFAKCLSSLDAYRAEWLGNMRATLQAWIAERDAELALPDPALETQRRIPELKRHVDRYEQAYSTFRDIARKSLDVTAAKELLQCIISIKSAKDQMIFDLPEQVKRFFYALQEAPSGGGAQLSFLTDEVTKWLEEHHQTSNYVIRRKGHSTW